VTRIYVASSWRNPHQPEIVERLRAAGHTVYDFRNPPGRTGFAWSEIDPAWKQWTAQQYIAALDHPAAVAGYASDFGAMRGSDMCILVLPCGRSAHLELGWMAGQGKRTAVLTRDGEEPELMARMVDLVTDDVDQLVSWASVRRGDRYRWRSAVTGRFITGRVGRANPDRTVRERSR